MSNLICSNCGNARDKGRRLCASCFTEHKRRIEKDRRETQGRYNYGVAKCELCSKEIKLWRRTQTLCKDCSSNLGSTSSVVSKTTNNYDMIGNRTAQNVIAEKTLGRKLFDHEVVHHMDENPRNNELNNLLVISRVMHGKLHQYLKKQRVILERSSNENLENCWDILRVPMTTAWLETTNAKVIKLWEIGQSAAKASKS